MHRRPGVAWSLMTSAIVATFAAPSSFAAPGDPLGPQFQINTDTAAFQSYADVARAADGRFVVVWPERPAVTFASAHLVARRYAADGTPDGPVFEIAASGSFPSVAMNDDGDFTVAWQTLERGTIYARRFGANGVPKADAVKVGGGSNASHPDVAMDDDGDFVVAWEQYDGVTVGGALACYYGTIACATIQGGTIRARRYTSGGTKAGAVQTVDTSTVVIDQNFVGSFSRHAGLAMGRDNSFVITWDRPGNGLLSGAWFRRYDALGLASAPTRVANQADETFYAGSTAPDVAMDGAGNFVIAFRKRLAFPEVRGIFVRRYRANGIAIGPVKRIDQLTRVAHDGNGPVVAMGEAGNFAVAWDTFDPVAPGVSPTISMRVFAADGTALRDRDAVPSASGASYVPRIAADAAGNFVVTWMFDEGPDGGDIAARRFEKP